MAARSLPARLSYDYQRRRRRDDVYTTPDLPALPPPNAARYTQQTEQGLSLLSLNGLTSKLSAADFTQAMEEVVWAISLTDTFLTRLSAASTVSVGLSF